MKQLLKPVLCLSEPTTISRGTLSLLISAIIIHALFNTLIQSRYRFTAYAVVLVIHIPSFITLGGRILSRRQNT